MHDHEKEGCEYLGSNMWDCGKIDGEPATDAPEMHFMNVYAITRHYGGPEEGGWWFDAGEPLASVPVDADISTHEELKLKAELWKRFAERYGYDPAEIDSRNTPTGRRRRNRYSVLGSEGEGGADLYITIEDHFACPWPERTPHYE